MGWRLRVHAFKGKSRCFRITLEIATGRLVIRILGLWLRRAFLGACSAAAARHRRCDATLRRPLRRRTKFQYNRRRLLSGICWRDCRRDGASRRYTGSILIGIVLKYRMIKGSGHRTDSCPGNLMR